MNKILVMLPNRLHHFRTVRNNMTGKKKNINNLFKKLRLEDDRQSESNKTNKSVLSSVLIVKDKCK